MKFISLWMAALSLLSLSPLANAQAWPARPLTWVVPFAAGGPTDVLARDIADKVSKQIGQNIIIENAAGAGGTLGATRVAKAKADGYVFLVGHMGYMGAAPSMYKKLAYDPVKDFDAVFRFPDTPLVLLVGKQSPFKSAADLIAAAKANPKKLNFGNAGIGSSSHLIAALFEARAGIDVTPIAYKGAAPAMADLIGGQVDAMFDQSNTALPQVAGGRLTAIALTSLKPMPAQYPGVVPLADKEIPGFEAATWYGLYAPKGVPADIVQKLHQAYMKALSDVEWTKKMSAQGIQLLSDAHYAPAAFARHTSAEVEKWRKVISASPIQLD